MRNLPLEDQNDIHDFLTSGNVPTFTALVEERRVAGQEGKLISGVIKVFLGAKYITVGSSVGCVKCTFEKVDSEDTNPCEGLIAAAAFIKILSIEE